MTEEDWLNWRAMDYLICWSMRREDYRAALLVQEMQKILRVITGGKFDIPSWDELIPAPIDCTKEARMHKLQEMKLRAVEKLKFMFGHLAKKKDDTTSEGK